MELTLILSTLIVSTPFSGDYGAYTPFVSPEFLPPAGAGAAAGEKAPSGGEGGKLPEYIPTLRKPLPVDGTAYDWMYDTKDGKWKQVSGSVGHLLDGSSVTLCSFHSHC